MKVFAPASFALLLFAIVMSSCTVKVGNGTDNDTGNGNPPQKALALNWESVPAEDNPSIDNIVLTTTGIQKIKMDMFSFSGDVVLTYSAAQPAGTATLKIFKVWKESASWGAFSSHQSGDSLELGSNGSYECSIRLKNGAIESLKGGCYVRLEVVLPVGSQIEVYNLGALISRRFTAMSNADLVKGVDSASFAKDKMAVIDAYLASYASVQKSPTLTAQELSQVLHQFPFKEDKFASLRKLHLFVADRQSLSAMIDQEFSYFDRTEAHQIAGI